MPLAFRILLEGVRDCDWTIAKVLAIHSLNSCIRGIKTGKVDESVTLGVARVRVSHDLGCLKDDAKSTESIIQQLLVDFWVQVPDEDVGTHV